MTRRAEITARLKELDVEEREVGIPDGRTSVKDRYLRIVDERECLTEELFDLDQEEEA